MFSLKAAHFQVDNMMALWYLMKMSGTGSREMKALAKEIWDFALLLENHNYYRVYTRGIEYESRLGVQKFSGF